MKNNYRSSSGPGGKMSGLVQGHANPPDPPGKFSFSLNKGIVLSFVLLFFVQVPYTQAQSLDSVDFFMQAYEYEKAIGILNKSDMENAGIEMVEKMALAMKGLNRYEGAIPYYEKLVAHDTANVQYLTDLAICFQSVSDYIRAANYYKKALLVSPGNNFLRQKLGDTFFQNEDYREAVKWYRKSYSTDSTYYLTKQLARCFEKLEIADTAIFYYVKVIEINPDDFQSVYRLATLLNQRGDTDSAITITNAYLERNPGRLKIVKYNAYLYFLKKDYLRAAAGFEKCIALGDMSEFTNKFLGFSYFKTGEYQKAKNWLEKAALTDTANVNLFYALGLSSDYSGHEEAGVTYLRKTVELIIPPPDFLSRVYQDLATAFNETKSYDEALEAYLEALELTPGDPGLLYTIASHYDNHLHDLDKALKFYGKFMETKNRQDIPLPAAEVDNGIVISYYDYAERRINEIKETIFWQGEKNDTASRGF